MDFHRFLQYEFFREWRRLKSYCRKRGIRVMGDIPIYVAHDSCDVQDHPELFELDEKGQPTVVSGVPPDYFSADGQLWGNPIIAGTALRAPASGGGSTAFATLSPCSTWSGSIISAGSKRTGRFRPADTARDGRSVNRAPRCSRRREKELGPLPIVAENLGVITPEVEAIRHQFDYPGMSVLQFAFGNDPRRPRPAPQLSGEVAAYTGTHDNDTTVGSWNSKRPQAALRRTRTSRKSRRSRAPT